MEGMGVYWLILVKWRTLKGYRPNQLSFFQNMNGMSTTLQGASLPGWRRLMRSCKYGQLVKLPTNSVFFESGKGETETNPASPEKGCQLAN